MSSYYFYRHAANLAQNAYYYDGLTPNSPKIVSRVNVASSAGRMRHEIKLGLINQQTTVAVLYTTADNPNASYEFANGTLLDSTQVLQVVMTNLDSGAQDGHFTIQYA